MAEKNMPAAGQNGNLTVEAVAGEPRIRDLDLAARLGFAKPTKIRDLIKRHLENLEAMGTVPTVGTVNRGQEATEFYLNRKQAIFITAKSETPQATEITIEIIEKFDAYERGAVPTVPQIDLSNPDQLIQLLTSYALDKKALMAKVEEQAPTVAAYDRIAKSEGSLCMTDAAKDLQIRPKDLFVFCRAHKWVYERPGRSGVIAYQDKIQAGYLEHKVTVVTRPDGSEKTVDQVRVTPKGLAKLARIVPGARGPHLSIVAA
jgi:phage antirepressor YoqD-like protein